ncbi:MAG: SDR family NAD(P)-dependent oxidoreductase [Chryseolinea sp.]
MKKIIITGASGNLGKASVEKFMKEGYKVITTVTPGKGLGFDVSSDVEIFEADLTQEQSVVSVISQIISKHQTVDAALMLVGGYAPGGIKEADGAVMKKMFTLNFETAYFVARPLFQQMLTQTSGGRLVFVGAKPGLYPKDASKSLAYGLSKSLIFHLAAALNESSESKDVTASVIVPSTIDTPVNRQMMPQSDFSAWVKPEEIADAMVYLCSDEAKAWRGTVLKIYGRS